MISGSTVPRQGIVLNSIVQWNLQNKRKTGWNLVPGHLKRLRWYLTISSHWISLSGARGQVFLRHDALTFPRVSHATLLGQEWPADEADALGCGCFHHVLLAERALDLCLFAEVTVITLWLLPFMESNISGGLGAPLLCCAGTIFSVGVLVIDFTLLKPYGLCQTLSTGEWERVAGVQLSIIVHILQIYAVVLTFVESTFSIEQPLLCT